MDHFKLNHSELSSKKMKIDFAALSLSAICAQNSRVWFNGVVLHSYSYLCSCAAFYAVILYNLFIMALLFIKWW
jgi:hypothetical protein